MSLYGHAVAAAYDPVLRSLEHARLASCRRELLGGLTGHVVDVGAGTGANLAHLPAQVDHVTAVEPDPAMARRLRRRVTAQAGWHRALGRDIEVVDGVAEALPLPDASVDAVLVTLVLCSVQRPEVAVAEARRVLRDDGVLVVLEHVRARGAARGLVQGMLTPVWRRVARGCHLDRDTLDTLARGGFDVQGVAPWQLSRRGPTVPAIAGHARLR